MADDIVTRLRQRAAGADDDYLSYAAADEIERLRAENISLHALIQSTYLKALGAWQQSCGYRQRT